MKLQYTWRPRTADGQSNTTIVTGQIRPENAGELQPLVITPVGTGISAVVMGTGYLLAGSNLWPTIIAHGTVNTFGFVSIYLGD